ncbi:hypothetical protein Fot_35085 [Forsythia ovata]|uniref:Uncharacterized protein n=1 Tax=Forsythia ovata TaxID=205694 RepID=A0ABD1SKI5_9LAMI
MARPPGVLPRYLRSYPTSTRKVLPNLHEDGHYRPRSPTSIYRVLPRYLKSPPQRGTLSSRRSYLDILGPTSISQVLPQYIRSYLDISGTKPTLDEFGMKKKSLKLD